MPPLPKKPTDRRRRNKSAGATTLVESDSQTLDHVPERWRSLGEKRPRPWVFGYISKTDGWVEVERRDSWMPQTCDWWDEIVVSPMAHEFLATDWHGLFRLAVLVDDYWQSGDAKLVPEIRQAQAAFGLTPVDRRRLQWEAAKGERADAQRRSSAKPAAPPSSAKRSDPRSGLRLVTGG